MLFSSSTTEKRLKVKNLFVVPNSASVNYELKVLLEEIDWPYTEEMTSKRLSYFLRQRLEESSSSR